MFSQMGHLREVIMRILTIFMASAAGAIMAGQAFAADLGVPAPTDVSSSSAFYLRGDTAWSFLEWNGGEDDNDFAFGGGFGVQFNDMVRADVTLDHTGSYRIGPNDTLSTTTLMGNAYLDFANDSMLTPYVGVGAGYGWVDGGGDGLALGAAAGVAVDVSDSIAVDAGYRFREILSDGSDVQEHLATVGMRIKF
jgi:opacity protein-like surface antigen